MVLGDPHAPTDGSTRDNLLVSLHLVTLPGASIGGAPAASAVGTLFAAGAYIQPKLVGHDEMICGGAI